jgi:hypothetical protein
LTRWPLPGGGARRHGVPGPAHDDVDVVPADDVVAIAGMPLFTLVTDPGPGERPTDPVFLAERSQHRVALISAAAMPERVLVRLGGTDRQELARPLLAGRPGCRPGTYTGATARPRRDPKVSANSPMTIKARARSLPGRKRNSTRTAPWRWGGLNLSMPGGKLTWPLVT